MKRIHFTDLSGNPYALGRNGTMDITGVIVTDRSEHVSLAPITSKGKEGRCVIEIPKNRATLTAVAFELLAYAGPASDTIADNNLATEITHQVLEEMGDIFYDADPEIDGAGEEDFEMPAERAERLIYDAFRRAIRLIRAEKTRS